MVEEEDYGDLTLMEEQKVPQIAVTDPMGEDKPLIDDEIPSIMP